MTAIAERSGSSIGALYNYFPDKQSIAFTLVNQYSQEVEAHWKPLREQAEILTHAEFADQFIERITQFVQERPAYLILLTAPIRFRRDFRIDHWVLFQVSIARLKPQAHAAIAPQPSGASSVCQASIKSDARQTGNPSENQALYRRSKR